VTPEEVGPMTDGPSVAPPADKEELVQMLTQAAELEHSLCVQYLYAAFTLKAAGEPGVTAYQAALTQQWHQQITRVALQEMYHLMIANNLLIAVDAPPNMWRPNYPQPSARYSDIDLPSVLAPFELDTVSRFMCWEKPDTSGWWDEPCRQCSEQALQRYGLTTEAPPPYNSIGELYTSIKEGFLANPGWIDLAAAERQVTSDLVPFRPPIEPIREPTQAARYIDVVVEEGEGVPDWDSSSHFAYFYQIIVELQSQNVMGLDLGWTTVDNPIYDASNEKPGASLITDASAASVGVLFNRLYGLLVDILARLFTPADDQPAQRRAFANASMVLMPLGVKPIGTILTRIPAGDAYPGAYAGPSFELPPALMPPTGSADEALAEFHDRLLEVARTCRILSLDQTGLGPQIMGQLGEWAARLETLLPLLDPGDVRGGVIS
jgi:Ferritin-like